MDDEISTWRRDLQAIFDAAVARVDGRASVRAHLQASPMSGPVHVVAVGKAAAGMAAGACDALGGAVADGLIITSRDYVPRGLLDGRPFTVVEGAHPLPDARSLAAGQAVIDYLNGLPPSAAVLFLISGGTSSRRNFVSKE